MNKCWTTLASLTLATTASLAQVDFTLQVLHASDLEGGVNAIDDAPNFAAIVQFLEENNSADGTLVLSAGDNIIPGPFFSASSDFSLAGPLKVAYENLFGLELDDPVEGSEIETRNGAIDITIMNIIGFDASAVGNHEFDQGTEILRDLLEEEFDTDRVDPSDNIVGPEIEWPGTQFPYLSANLDFSGDENLSGIVTDQILTADAFALDLTTFDNFNPSQGDSTKIAPAVVINVNGEQIGVVGGTTQRLQDITSNGGVEVIGASDNDIPLLAMQIQATVDQLLNENPDVDKIILVTHLQQFALEQQLAADLANVDVIIAGGSDFLLADEDDTLRAGDTAEGDYPTIVTGEDGNPVALVSTDGEYSYVGRLTIAFDANGVVLTDEFDSMLNGPIATTEDQVEALWGDLATAFAEGTRGLEVRNLVDPVTAVVNDQDSNVFGYTAVFLDGTRNTIRTEEGNMGNLTADANLWKARQFDDSVVFSFKNGGGIRNPIGETNPETGELLPPQPNPNRPVEGAVSELLIADVLRFNNGLVTFDLSGEDILEIFTHGFAASTPGSTQGRFPQIAGIQVSFVPPTDGGDPVEVRSFALVNEDGSIAEILYQDGEFVGDAATREFTGVSLDFLVQNNGDGYPFTGENGVASNVVALEENGGEVGEQQALQEYLAMFFPTPDLAYSEEEVPPAMDTRVQNLNERLDTVGVPGPIAPPGALRLSPVATFETGVFDESAAEIVAYDSSTQRLFVVGSADTDTLDPRVFILDASDPIGQGLVFVDEITFPGEPNSVAVFTGESESLVAVAVADSADDVRGIVRILNADSLEQVGSDITVGFLPDMLTFTPDGTKIVVANEGEPSLDDEDLPVSDVPGSISIIDVATQEHTEVSFERWNRRERILESRGVLTNYLREFPEIVGTVGQDLEPEFVVVTPDSRYAWVALQEANAVALVDLEIAAIRNILSLGTVNFGQQPADLSDRDGGINIRTWDGVFGLRQPDAIGLTTDAEGNLFLLTANEGDARDFEEERLKDFDASDFAAGSIIANDPSLLDDENLGRLEFNSVASDIDGDGVIEQIFAYGGRGMTVFEAPIIGRFRAVTDTGADVEHFTASLFSTAFNVSNDDPEPVDPGEELEIGFEGRSDAKAGEPEALTIGQIGDRSYAFLGLERQSVIMVYDVTDPSSLIFHDFASNRGFMDMEGNLIAADQPEAGDLGPEGFAFIAADVSPVSGVPMLAVANEVSGTVTIWRIDQGVGE